MHDDYLNARDKVIEELGETLGQVPKEAVNQLLDCVTKHRKVFVIGTGRVMLIMQALAKRLMHLGIDSYVVGETTIPPLNEGDLLIAGSASGETMTTVNMAKLGKKLGAVVAVITASPESALARISDICIVIPARAGMKRKGESKSVHPMDNLFEESLLLFSDIICTLVQKKLGISQEEMWKRHTNLE